MARVWESFVVPSEAVIIALLFEATLLVLMVKVVELLPAATVTLVGTLAIEGLLFEMAIERPLAGATPERVTVPVVVFPPVTVDGLSEKADSDAGLIVIFTFLLIAPNLAEIIADVLAVTP